MKLGVWILVVVAFREGTGFGILDQDCKPRGRVLFSGFSLYITFCLDFGVVKDSRIWPGSW